jgi:hypothetical protein
MYVVLGIRIFDEIGLKKSTGSVFGQRKRQVLCSSFILQNVI